MKAKSRRRLLISSIAMLLVAMLALGTATFAWFTTSTSTTAQGVNVQTVKSSELKVSRWDHNWGDDINYNFANLTMKPASSPDGTNWYKADAATKNSYEANDDGFVSAGTLDIANNNTAKGIANYVFVDELNIKNVGQVAATDVQIQITGTFSDYVYVALVPANDDHTLSGTFGTGTVYAKSATEYTPAPAETTTTKITPSTTRTITASASLAKDAAVYYRLYVWFEGQDTDCKDVNAGQTLPDLKFTITASTGQA